MLKQLAPMAVIPPSPKKMAWMASAMEMARIDPQGPSTTVAIPIPAACPVVPPGSGRLNIITTKLSFSEALAESVHQNVKGASLILEFLKGVIERRMSAKQFSGPIGIAQLSGEAAREGPTAFVHLMQMVSLNLAIFNLLPIPILDGGVILLLLVEMLLGRDLSMPVKEAVIKVGFVFLLVVTVFAVYNDISKILPPG